MTFGKMDGLKEISVQSAGEHLWWLTLLALSLFLIARATIVIYNLFFHPLRHFSGPWLAAATPLPFIFHLCNGSIADWTTELHQKYGEVVRVQPDELFFATSSAWHDIYHCRPELPKPEVGALRSINGVRPIAGVINIEDHNRQRRILMPAFSDRALKEQHYIFQNYSDLLIERLAQVSQQDDDIDLHKWLMFTTVDIVTDLGFGKSFNCLTSGEYHPWVATIFKYLKTVEIYASLTYLPPLETVVTFLTPPFMKQKARKHFAYITKQVEERINRKTDRPDFMKFILENGGINGGANGMTRDEIDSTMRGLVLAGSETSSTAMTSAMWFSLTNGDVWGKLRNETRSAFSKYEDINVTSTSKLPYLHAVIQEAMRLHSPVPTSRPRLVNRPDVVISGRPVPIGVGCAPPVLKFIANNMFKQTRVGVPQKATFKRAANFVDPLSFIPERWLPEPDPKYSADDKQAFHPFGTGSRICPGQPLAWAEMKLALCKVLWSFDIELTANNAQNWADQKVFHLNEKKPLYVRLTPTGLSVPNRN